MNLWNYFVNNEKEIIHKWHHYFPIYEKHFSQWRNKTLTFLEIGVQNGGSTKMWRNYFGPYATIVGIDITPECKNIEKDGIHIRIGSQSDVKFLQNVIDEFGVPDIILDDGGHIQKEIMTSFEFLYPKMPKNSIYLIEDLHTSYYETFGGGLCEPSSVVNRVKGLIDNMHEKYVPMGAHDWINRDTFSINIYDSIVCFEKGGMKAAVNSVTGKIQTI